MDYHYSHTGCIVAVLRLGYLGAAASVLFVCRVPSLRSRFLAYGPRAVSSAQEEKKGRPAPSAIVAVLDQLARIQVPHGWFTSFYAISVTCSLLWASQLFLPDSIFDRIVVHAHEQSVPWMTWRQVLLTWSLMLVQGSRRLYECMAFYRPSRSQMWFGHWAIGLGFYLATSAAVWVEGIYALQTHNFSLKDAAITAPDLRTFTAIILFILASGVQHDCHAYLASLKSASTSTEPKTNEYKLPTHPAFHTLIAPHYTSECMIYLSLTLVAAPQGAWLNWTFFCALVFVVVNLGVTADSTKDWYEAEFGQDAVKDKRKMIPFVY